MSFCTAGEGLKRQRFVTIDKFTERDKKGEESLNGRLFMGEYANGQVFVIVITGILICALAAMWLNGHLHAKREIARYKNFNNLHLKPIRGEVEYVDYPTEFGCMLPMFQWGTIIFSGNHVFSTNSERAFRYAQKCCIEQDPDFATIDHKKDVA